MKRVFLFLKGMAMGAADVVPGVSGGTIAFITGIYSELIDSLKSINAEALRKLFKEGIPAAWQHINGNFLVVLFTGIIFSVVSLAKGITYLLENHPVLVWAFFFGLIVASAILIGTHIKKWSWDRIVGMLLGIAVAYYITVASPAETSEAYWFIFLSGALAICAMILPGISGSFILLLLGKYRFILESLSEFKVGVILTFILGCVFGLLSFARLLSWMFHHARELTIAILTGFMIGSLNKVWPWKVTLETTVDRHGEIVPLVQKSVLPNAFPGDPQTWWAIGVALAGFLVIWILEKSTPRQMVGDDVMEE